MKIDTDSRPILVGFDPQTLDRAPVHFAVAAARLTGAPLIVSSVCAPTPITDSLPPPYADEELTQLGVQAMAELKAELETGGVWIEYSKLHGTSAAHALHEEADRLGARLLVVGSSARGAIGRIVPGSTAERLMHGAPCAVAVVPSGGDPHGHITTIGVAFADTVEGLEALRGAYALARRADAVLRVLSVVREHIALYGEIRPGGRIEPGLDIIDVEGGHRLKLESVMRAAVARLPGLASDVTIEVDALVGDPADTLNHLSERLDLLVCGSRGYGPLRAVLLGGVSRRVIAAASCPVIVLARGVESALEPTLDAAAYEEVRA